MRPLAIAVAFLLAGCLGASDEASPGPPAPSSGPPASPEATDTGNGTVVPPPRELHNESYRYPHPVQGGQPVSGSFDVPADARRIALILHAYADCPAFTGQDNPAIVVTRPDGREALLERFGGNSGGGFAGRCSNAGLAQEYLGAHRSDTDALAGTWTFTSQGTFTGDVRLVAASDLPA